MPTEAIRPVSEGDQPALAELERACPQGTRLLLHTEREDYLFRSRLYPASRTMVAVDVKSGRLIGVMGAALKELLLAGAPRKLAFFYDLRVHPDYRTSLQVRHMLRIWNLLEQWARDNGAAAIVGFVKDDKEPMIGLREHRDEWSFAAKMCVISRSVHRRLSVGVEPAEARLDDGGETIAREVEREYGRRELFPECFGRRYLTEEMQKSGLFSAWTAEAGGSFASVGIYKHHRAVRMRVLRLPPLYRFARPLLNAAGTLLPLPRIPAPGDTVRSCILFNHIARGPDGTRLWRELVRHANNVALADGATLLSSAFDSTDGFLPLFARGALNRIDYRLGINTLGAAPLRSLTPFYPDVRDMD